MSTAASTLPNSYEQGQEQETAPPEGISQEQESEKSQQESPHDDQQTAAEENLEMTQMSEAATLTAPQVPVAEEPPSEAQSGLKASKTALDFIASIQTSDFELMAFQDILQTKSADGKELGDFKVTVSPAEHQNEKCFLIHANSFGSIDGVPCGTSVTTYVNYSLETLYQEHVEFVKLENHTLDRKTFLTKSSDNYNLRRVITQGKEVKKSESKIAHQDMEGFISEGSNLLLMRLLVIKGVPTDFQCLSLDADSNLCRATYTKLIEKVQPVQEQDLEVLGIERTLLSTTELPITWQSYFLKDGHLASRVQIGSPVTMTLMKVPKPLKEDNEEVKPTFEKKELVWEDDMQMFSKFLDRKDELKNNHAVYIKQHPELPAILADFLQFTLLRKPKDTLAFAAEYFSSFSSSGKGSQPFPKSSSPQKYVHSKVNPKMQKIINSQTHGRY